MLLKLIKHKKIVIMKKMQRSFLTILLVLFAIGMSAQPQFPCSPGTECPPAPAPCSQQSDCIPSDPEPPVGDAIPLDGASTILLIVGIGIIGGRKIADKVKIARKES